MDWQLTCRVCLESGDMVSLFDWDDNNEQLSDKYTFCCGVEVPKEDTLPTLICLNCVDRLAIAHQFKKQCLSSNETLKECLDEFLKSSAALSASSSNAKVVKTETITIKQENGLLLQYELPVEHDPSTQWTITKHNESAVVTKAPGPRKRGRPRKYPNEQGEIEMSPYTRKKPKTPKKEPESLTTLLASGTLDLKQEPEDEDNDNADLDIYAGDNVDDPDFNPEENIEDSKDDDAIKEECTTPRKRGRPRKPGTQKQKKVDDSEDVLLKETIMAFSEPIPEHVLNPKPKKKTTHRPDRSNKKRYFYDKTHTCETCGSSFTSNASLQAHIRRHLGIKPFVCSVCGYSCVLNMELRRHMLRHTGVRPYKCRICERRFGDFGSRQKHESICGYNTSAQQNLKRHLLIHTDLKPFECDFCNKAYREKGDLKKHLRRQLVVESSVKIERTLVPAQTSPNRLHMGVRPYQCSLCGKSFTYSYVLSNHMLTHTGEKKYACVPCNKKFTKAHHLKYHNKVHHKVLYMQQQLEAEAKKAQKTITTSGLLTGEIVDGTITLLHTTDGDETIMQVVEESELENVQESEVVGGEQEEDKETDTAVANMQGVVMEDYCIQIDEDETKEHILS